VISPTELSHDITLSSDSIPRFHWKAGTVRGMPTYHLQRFPKAGLICIGTLAAVNSNCTVDENSSYSSSTSAFGYLGVRDSHWVHDETSIGLQSGQYIMATYARTKHRRDGTTLKFRMLDDVETQSYLVKDILNDLSGVQVSFCTGVARRVPLRLLLADLMPIIAQVTPKVQAMWMQLNDQQQATQALRSGTFPDWFLTLSSSDQEFINQLMINVLQRLEPTGVHEGSNELIVAWIHQRPYKCVKIPFSDRTNSWMRVLADSGDCATFAYITTDCLETDAIRCRSASSWHNTFPLLETAVLRHNLQPSIPLGPLEHDRTYFFLKEERLLHVTVRKEPGSSTVSLYVAPSGTPPNIWRRLRILERTRKEASRIRERRESDELGSEAVTILTKSNLHS
jgi:hypothetical protein